MTLVGDKDPTAFEVFYDRHGGAAFSLALRIVGDRGLAEDVAQEAFLSIWRSEAGYDPARGSVRSWTLGIVRNRAIDALRRAAAPAPRLDLDDDGVLEAQRSPEPRPTPRSSAARPRARSAACCAAADRAVAGDRARLLRRLQPLRDRQDAGDAAGNREGPDAPRPGEGPRARSPRAWACARHRRRCHERRSPPERRDDIAAYALGALDEPASGRSRARTSASCERAAPSTSPGSQPAVDVLPASVPQVDAAGSAEARS